MKTYFAAAKDLAHSGLGGFLGRAPLDQDDIFEHIEAGQVLFRSLMIFLLGNRRCFNRPPTSMVTIFFRVPDSGA